MSGTIRTGVGGWTFEPWRGVFYPGALKQKDELGYMSRQLRSIEMNLHVTHLAASSAHCPATTPKARIAHASLRALTSAPVVDR